MSRIGQWLQQGLYRLHGSNRGMGTVEVILIIVVLIAAVVIFKSQLTSLVQTIFTRVSQDALSI